MVGKIVKTVEFVLNQVNHETFYRNHRGVNYFSC